MTRSPIVALFILSLSVLAISRPASAQQQPATQPPERTAPTDPERGEESFAEPKQEIKIFTLQNMRAQEAKRILSEVASSNRIRFAVDDRANTLIAVGTNEMLSIVEAVLMRLDESAVTKAKDAKLTVMKLKYMPVQQVFQAVENLKLDGAKIEAEGLQNALIVFGSEEVTQRITQLVQTLDVNDVPPEMEDAQIRVVWLVDRSLAKEDALPVPEDLRPTIERLSKRVGIGELRTVAQMLVNVGQTNPGIFGASGTAALDKSYNVDFAGAMNSKSRLMETKIKAREGKAEPICNLNTTLKVEPGHPVILGMTTLDSKPSLFVVELLNNVDDSK